jgi:hypothetical protein
MAKTVSYYAERALPRRRGRALKRQAEAAGWADMRRAHAVCVYWHTLSLELLDPLGVKAA